MKSIVSKLHSHFDGFNAILFTAYSVVILIASVLLIDSSIAILRNTLYVLLGCFLFCPLILKAVKKDTRISEALNKSERIKPLDIFAVAFPFFILLYQYIIYYPGGFSHDSIKQYNQVLTGNYNDWHPVIQTLLAFKVPLMLTGGWIGSIVLFQLIAFAFVLAYTHRVLVKHTNSKVAAAVIFYISLNPTMLNTVIHPWKDVSFAMGALLLMDFSLEIYFSDGKWIKSAPHTIVFTVVFVLTTLFRHNALMFTIPLLIAIACCISKKRTLAIAVASLVLIAGIRVPFYNAIGVEQPDQRQVETLGLPLSVIGGVHMYCPNRLNSETKEFLYKLAPKEEWEKHYDKWGFNSIKFNDNTNLDVIEEYGTRRILKMTADCFAVAPIPALRSVINVTNCTYSVMNDTVNSFTNHICYICTLLEGSEVGIEYKGIPALQNLSNNYTVLCLLFLPHVFISIGTLHLLLLLVLLARCSLKKRKDLKKMLFALPVFIYNFSTMLLLSSSMDTIRFYYYTFLTVPIIMILLFKKK
ncbi:MAG: hypothetical protein IKS12_05645 [Eubacterium sp.]|nr:hypothetical protein [Eubacterium sp.]